MSTFINLRQSKKTVNIDQIAYIDEQENGDVILVFATPDPTPNAYTNGEMLTLVLTGGDAQSFMSAINRRSESW